MFSRREREFLRLLGQGSAAEGTTAARRRFPSPAYRRRLLWGIRQKATAATADWRLFVRAASNEPRVVRPSPLPNEPVPSYSEPLAALVERLSRRPGRRRRVPGPRRRRKAP